MKKVSREAGVSQGILHYYFADKRAILVAALRAVMDDLDARVRAAQARSGRDPAARLRAINARLYARMRRLIGALIRQGTRGGQVRAVEASRAAAVVLGLLDGVALQLTFDRTAFDVATAARVCQDALGRYLAR